MTSQLISAVFRESLGEVQAALRSGSPVDQRDDDGRTALFHAVIDGLDAIAQTLLSAGAEVNATDYLGMTPLHYAAQEKRAGIARMLVAAGANPNASDANGNTPVHRAVFAFDAPGDAASVILHALVARGADFSVRNSAGVSPEGLARTRGLDLATLLGSQ